MKRHNYSYFFVLVILSISTLHSYPCCQDSILNSENKSDTILKYNLLETESATIHDNYNQNLVQNQIDRKKFWPAMGTSLIYNSSMGIFLLLMPDDITNWHKQDKFKLNVMMSQYKSSFTKPPVIDFDYWYINYLGHPYQGSFYFNSIRSRGGTFWESTLFNLGQSCFWEYVWEGGLEQPSIQDLLVTPIFGSLVGELSHRATKSMARNGFNWYEKITVCLINPSYVLNNGFRVNHHTK